MCVDFNGQGDGRIHLTYILDSLGIDIVVSIHNIF